MPETVIPEPEDANESDLETEPDAEAEETPENDAEPDAEEEPPFYIPTPGGLRGL
ncbi:hypothetical protein [Halomarina rubra]|uniref:Uncharacterized protein n=1 Tax=Halomarina rubra TaxID=2071873 RepID=A0ABD6B0W0_9EURY|nr:hypothetical protein [Halomarina rubra]